MSSGSPDIALFNNMQNIKLLMLGDSAVGKSALIDRYTNNSFSPAYISTVGVDFRVKNIVVDDKRIKLQIWDTAGQERFRSISKSYYKSANGILLVYDVTDRSSFDSIRNWIKQIQMHADSGVCKILVGNKCDCENDRKITEEEGLKLSKEYKISFCETSAKDDVNVENSFLTLVGDIIRNHPSNRNSIDRNTIHLQSENGSDKNEKSSGRLCSCSK
eukprot:gene12350-16564_t